MCGIFGIVSAKESNYSENFYAKSLKQLAYLSESRGKDSSGLCAYNQIEDCIDLVKGPITIKKLFNSLESKKITRRAFKNKKHYKYAFGHSRLVTNGSQLDNINNQPIVKNGVISVHNGIIANSEKLWKENTHLNKETDIDTEILVSLIRDGISSDYSLQKSLKNAFNKIDGTVAIASVFSDFNNFILATNNGSLYVLHNNKDILFFASEEYIITKFISNINISDIGDAIFSQVNSNSFINIDLDHFSIQTYSLSDKSAESNLSLSLKNKSVNIDNIETDRKQLPSVLDLNEIHLNLKASDEQSLLQYPINKIKEIKRCAKCLLPKTFPFIYYDEIGICNYCSNYNIKKNNKSMDELNKVVNPYRKSNRKPEVLVPLSGGRDSIYALHVVKEDLGLNPVTYTYDWGMVTDLARRNGARICGKLGVENIIVAADIHWKRENIKKNIIAWLREPALGMIPLFMAGDKYFFYYAYKIKKQLDIDLEIWGVNDLENTDFKTGFAGIKPKFNKKRIYSLSLVNQLKLFSFVGKNILKSPKYINQSVFDSLGSIASRYVTPKADYYHIFDYIDWNEEDIENTIMNKYNWEKAVDTDSTWRIGDGTASFYNYVYTLIAGFSENDTFRSNQIRQGLISREEGLDLIYKENEPRYNSLKWYLNISGLDFNDVINKINKIQRLY